MWLYSPRGQVADVQDNQKATRLCQQFCIAWNPCCVFWVSKSSNIKIEIGNETIFQNLEINILKCQNSKFDDDPEVTAYMQVKDLTSKNKNQVFIFNGWTFASSPSLRPFDHPVYDIWLKKCFS